MTSAQFPATHAKRPSPVRITAMVAAVIFAIGTPIVQALAPFGLSASQFANDGNETLRAAGYAFSIWSVIYAGLAAYALYQAWPSTSDTPLLGALGWPSVIAIAGCGAWILASAFDLKAMTVLIIAVSAGILTFALTRSVDAPRSARDTWFVIWPLSLLAGWLTIATAINALTVLTAFGAINQSAAPVAGAIGLAIVVIVALVVLHRTRFFGYGIPIAWGLAAVYVAEREHRPMIALGAAASALIVGGFSLWAATHAASVASAKGMQRHG